MHVISPRGAAPIATSMAGPERVIEYLIAAAARPDPALTIEQVARDVFGVEPDRALQTALGTVLRAAGWAPEQVRIGDERARVYRPIRGPRTPVDPEPELAEPPLKPGWASSYKPPPPAPSPTPQARTRPAQKPSAKAPPADLDRRILACLGRSDEPLRGFEVASRAMARKSAVLGRLGALANLGLVEGPPWRLARRP